MGPDRDRVEYVPASTRARQRLYEYSAWLYLLAAVVIAAMILLSL